MLEERMLKILIREVIQENLKLRTSKGYNASHPVISHKPFMLGLGKSDYEDEETEDKQKHDAAPVKVSKAFEKDPLDDLREYQQVLEELLNET
jgi:hypothetical protein